MVKETKWNAKSRVVGRWQRGVGISAWMILLSSLAMAQSTGSLKEYVRLGGRIIAIENSPPITSASVGPATGNGGAQTFTAVYSDGAGYGDLSKMKLIIQSADPNVTLANGCTVRYDQIGGVFNVLNDTATGWIGAVAPHSNVMASNSQCTLYGNFSYAQQANLNDPNTLQVYFQIAFNTSYTGTKNIYLWARNEKLENSGTLQAGPWTISAQPQITVVPPFTASVVTPPPPDPPYTLFVAQYNDTAGYTNLSKVQIPIMPTSQNPDFSGANSCTVRYDLNTGGGLSLLDNTGAWQNPISLTSGLTLSNSQCTLWAKYSSIQPSGNSFTFKAAITFSSSYTGTKNVYQYARNDQVLNGQNIQSGRWLMGTWTITGGQSGPPASITATGGSGQTAVCNTAFATNLQATVRDANSNPVSNATVTFTAPSSGYSGLFGSSTTATALTNSSGVATAPTFTANGTAGGPYTVTATVSGVSTSANFSLTNQSSQPSTYNISGTVTVGGQGLAGVTVVFEGNSVYTTTTDSFGNYLQGLPINVVYFVYAVAPNYYFLPGWQEIVLTNNVSGVNFSGTALQPYIGVTPQSGTGPGGPSSGAGWLFTAVDQPQMLVGSGLINSAEMLFNTTGVDNAVNACHLFFYFAGTPPTYLFNDAGTAYVSPTLSTYPVYYPVQHGNQLAYNSHCLIDTYNASVDLTQAQQFEWQYPIYFFPSFNGVRNVYIRLTSVFGNHGPWIQVGSWNVANPSGSDPTITITSPGATATGTVPISGAVSDPNSAIASVIVYIDGAKQTPAATVNNTTHTYTWSWNTATSGTGAHTITVFATDSDATALQAVASQTVTVH